MNKGILVQMIGAALIASSCQMHQKETISLPKKEITERPEVEIVFILDNTGSMSGLIQTAKEKIWSIATSMSQTDPAPEIKLGLIGYRDRGDQYITRSVNLTSDLDSLYGELMNMEAQGGGDGPESVNQALYEGITRMSWTSNKKAFKVAFLVGDYPPHMDYANDVKWMTSCSLAVKNQIPVNTIQMGNYHETTPVWKQIANLTGGQYICVDQRASDITIATPFDDTIAAITDSLDDSRVFYGTSQEQVEQHLRASKSKAMKSSMSLSVKSRRGIYNASKSGSKNFAGKKELLSDMEKGDIDLKALNNETMPQQMQCMTDTQRKTYVDSLTQKRKNYNSKILELQKKRQEYINSDLRKKDPSDTSFTDKVYETVKKQAKSKGIEYKEKAQH